MAIRIDCYYGQSGTGKSKAAAEIIKRVYQETGKTARVAVGDGSGATYIDEGLVDANIVQLMDFSIRDWPISTMQQLSEGYWPVDPEDPKSPLKKLTPEEMAKIGCFVFEGLSVGAAYVMGDKKGGLAERGARGEKIGQDSPIMVCDLDRDQNGMLIKGSGTGLTFGGNPLAHYGFVQRRLLDWIERSKRLPGIVIWSAHERQVDGKAGEEPLIGPEAAGSALTGSLPRHFNNTLHFVTASKRGKVKDDHTGRQIDDLDIEYRIYTRDHVNPNGLTPIKYKAVCRCAKPEMMPLFLVGKKAGENIVEFYEILAKAKAASLAEMIKKPQTT